MTGKKLQVAMLIQAYLPRFGGAERQLAALLPLLKQRDVETFILTRRYSGLSAFEEINGTPVYRLPIWGPKPMAAFTYIAAAQMHIARLRPDVIHAHELLSPASAAQLAHRIWGMPVVAKVLGGGKNGDIDKLRRRPFGQQRLAGLRRQIDTFITVSSEINNELIQIGVPAERRLFIPNGVDTQRFSPVPPEKKMQLRKTLGLPIESPIAIFSGRLVPGKHVDRLLAAWRNLQEEFPQALLLIIGSGEEESRLRQMSGENVQFIGQVEDVTPYLQSSDFFVLPSAAEGLSNALLEALSVGLPCIATAVGGTPDVIVDGENGLLITPDKADELRAALLKLLSDDSLRQRMGEQARATIQARYSLENTADQLAALYMRLAKRRMDSTR
jgi:glycosyltransferase involved in cell wall biosynthesis